MKTLNIPLEDAEYAKLVKRKGKWSWRNFIMKLSEESEPYEP